MSFTYDLTTDVGRVRRTIPDKTEATAIWSDEEIESFIEDEGDWRRASAAALEAIASNHLLVLKVVRIHNLETNTDRLARELMARAKLIRTQANEADVNAGDSWDVAEVIVTDSQFRERLWNQRLRES
jgi:hypothetical protein